MADLKHEKLLKLYELAINEEHRFLDAHQHRVAFYSGILSALVAGTVVGVFKASEWYHLAILCVGPVLICAVSTFAIHGTYRFYQRFLEAVTIRAKIEQELGLTKKRSANINAADFYWQSEPIVPRRHIKDCEGYESSEAFIKDRLKKGYQLWTRCFFLQLYGDKRLNAYGYISPDDLIDTINKVNRILSQIGKVRFGEYP